MATPSWLNDFYQAKRLVLASADQMVYLADAFRATGNEQMAERLEDYADNLYKAGDLTKRAMGKVTSQISQSAFESTANMALMALGVSGAQENEEDE
jgi:hypothetical protein